MDKTYLDENCYRLTPFSVSDTTTNDSADS